MVKRCKKCKKKLPEHNFFRINKPDKYPDGLFPVCKSCIAFLRNERKNKISEEELVRLTTMPDIPDNLRHLVMTAPMGQGLTKPLVHLALKDLEDSK